MLRRTLPIATAAIWVITIAYTVASVGWDHGLEHSSVGGLLRTAAGVLTVALVFRLGGVEYRLGYRQGRADQMGEQD